MTASYNTRFLRRTVWEAMTPEQMVERYAAGASMDDIGFLTGTSGHKVRRILVAHGVTIRPPCRSRPVAKR
jgi:hypothetical protein